MLEQFLKDLFEGKTLYQDLSSVFVIGLQNKSLVKLYLEYICFTRGENQILLPKEFLNPEFELISFELGQKIKLSKLVQVIADYGYSRVENVFEEMQFCTKGDTLTIYTNVSDLVFRVSFFDDVIEEIYLLDSINLRIIKKLRNFFIANCHPGEISFRPEIIGSKDLYSKKPFVYSDGFVGNFKRPKDHLEITNLPLFFGSSDLINSFISKHLDYHLYYAGSFYENFKSLLKEKYLSKVLKLELQHINVDCGFVEKRSKIILLTDYEVFGSLNLENFKKTSNSKFHKFFESKLNFGDFVVHELHGIGIYRGIEEKTILGERKKFAVIEYQNNDLLLVPFNQLSRLSKYVSVEGYEPKLTKLGSAEWEVVRRKLKKNMEDVAKELLQIYAKKRIEKGFEFPKDSEIQEAFESNAPFELTEDQIKTLNEVKNDMESPRPMDRLIIGDVGFGKTEIAIRAALKCVLSGKQVAVIAPTTILATQLFNVFKKRFENLPISIKRLTRFDKASNNKKTLQEARESKVDILIGTHRLLSKDVELPNLGLLIIDEEQRFGVRQKEKIRKLRPNIDVLSMSATPIPRTLHMALTGIKDISVISTPPKGRLPVITEIIFQEEIPDKVLKEISRGGQVFIVHNRIEDMDTFVMKIEEKLPRSVKIVKAHGQMKSSVLERIMLDFLDGKYQVLVSTTIVENGLDIPSVNTIIIDDTHELGLSQIYQLRGRVGRSSIQAYCYLVVPKVKEFIKIHKDSSLYLKDLQKVLDEQKIENSWITQESVSRIKTILENQELGAGFKIASRDLEIRGSGNLIGIEQSGHINSVGYELYVRLLEQEIEKIKHSL